MTGSLLTLTTNHGLALWPKPVRTLTHSIPTPASHQYKLPYLHITHTPLPLPPCPPPLPPPAPPDSGASIRVRHIRGANETQPLAGRAHWSRRYQGVDHVLPESRRLEPGDALLTSCTYNTTGKTAAVNEVGAGGLRGRGGRGVFRFVSCLGVSSLLMRGEGINTTHTTCLPPQVCHRHQPVSPAANVQQPSPASAHFHAPGLHRLHLLLPRSPLVDPVHAGGGGQSARAHNSSCSVLDVAKSRLVALSRYRPQGCLHTAN